MRNHWLQQAEQKHKKRWKRMEIQSECCWMIMKEAVYDEYVQSYLDYTNDEKPISVWDFQTALGDVIKERHESQYVKVVEVDRRIYGEKTVEKYAVKWTEPGRPFFYVS